jgi:hypothetical protein
MKLQNMVRVFAGTFVFISALLGFFHSKWWLLFTMFVGLNLFQYGFTNWCLLAEMLKKIGVKE